MNAASVEQSDDAAAVEVAEPLIEVKNLSVVFDSQAVLENINLSIDRGQTVAIIGASRA